MVYQFANGQCIWDMDWGLGTTPQMLTNVMMTTLLVCDHVPSIYSLTGVNAKIMAPVSGIIGGTVLSQVSPVQMIMHGLYACIDGPMDLCAHMEWPHFRKGD